MADGAPPANRKVRLTGVVLLVLAVLGYVGAATGWDAHGTGGRIAFAVVATVLLVVGALLMRVRTPAVEAVHADARGLSVRIRGGRSTTVPWSDVDAVWLRLLRTVLTDDQGYALGLRLTATAMPQPVLRPFRTAGTSELLIGLPHRVGTALHAQLPQAAGARYSERG